MMAQKPQKDALNHLGSVLQADLAQRPDDGAVLALLCRHEEKSVIRDHGLHDRHLGHAVLVLAVRQSGSEVRMSSEQEAAAAARRPLGSRRQAGCCQALSALLGGAHVVEPLSEHMSSMRESGRGHALRRIYRDPTRRDAVDSEATVPLLRSLVGPGVVLGAHREVQSRLRAS